MGLTQTQAKSGKWPVFNLKIAIPLKNEQIVIDGLNDSFMSFEDVKQIILTEIAKGPSQLEYLRVHFFP